MSEMVERVGRQIFGAIIFAHPDAFHPVYEREREVWEEAARSAIEAMQGDEMTDMPAAMPVAAIQTLQPSNDSLLTFYPDGTILMKGRPLEEMTREEIIKGLKELPAALSPSREDEK